jgi:PKD repeat protein
LTLPSYFGKDEMEIAVSGNDTNIVYALVENASRIQGILKTSNAGVSFDTVASHPIDDDGGVSQAANIKDFSRNQAWYDLSLAVDPNNPNVVVVGGIDLFKTTNGGGSWSQISHWYGGFGYQEVHADQHYAYFEPGSSSVCYFGNDGGVYRCANFTASMPTIDSKEINYNTTQFYAGDIHPIASSNLYLAGAQDNGSHSFSAAGINNTSEVTGGDGAFCHIDQNQPNYWFTSYVYTSYYRSSNGGSSFSNVLNTSVNVGSFINPSDYDDVNNKMYLCGNNSYFVRWENPQTGNSLTYDTVALFNGGKITHVKVSPNINNRVYFGLNNGRIVRIDNANISATIDSCINNGKGMPSGSVSCIEVETGNDNHILATYSNYGVASVWETKDGGLTWTNVEGNLPDMPIRWALFNPNKNWQVLLATELGVWSTDSLRAASTNWQPSNSGFSNVRTDMLKMRGSDKQVLAATHGRGVFTSSVFSPPTADFTVDRRIAYQSSILNFTSNSNGASTYSWNFGDGTFSTAQNPTKQYLLPGFYTVTLNINSGLSIKSQTNYIQILPYRPVPYLVASGGNFESNPNDFGPETISGIGFVRGNATTTGKNGVASGSNAWVTGLTGNYSDNNEARLYTPNFNFGASGTYTIRFKVKNKFEINYDGYIVEYSLNLGSTWVKLGNSVQTNWYDFANGSGSTAFPINTSFFTATNSTYTNKQFDVSFLAGNPKVCFRWVFKSDGGVTDVGMALDDFEVLGPTNAALPVSLSKFLGNRITEKLVSLHWQTSSEENNKGFSIEKSTDGFNFNKIGFVKGAGQSNSILSYSFQDHEASQDHLYYRLNQIDFNGDSHYSNIVYIDQNQLNEKIFSIQYLLNNEGILIEGSSKNMSLKIWNQGGQLIQSIELIEEINKVNLNHLPKGIYLLEMADKTGNRQVEKLIWLGE